MRNFLFRGKSLPSGILGDRSPGFAGYTFTCNRCGDQWGKLDFGKTSGRWLNYSWVCDTHTTRFQRGGSIFAILGWDYPKSELLAQFTHEQLVHEVLMIFNQREQYGI